MSTEKWINIPEDLSTRMYDIVTAVAHGHESLFLMAEAVHLLAAIDKLFLDEVD